MAERLTFTGAQTTDAVLANDQQLVAVVESSDASSFTLAVEVNIVGAWVPIATLTAVGSTVARCHKGAIVRLRMTSIAGATNGVVAALSGNYTGTPTLTASPPGEQADLIDGYTWQASWAAADAPDPSGDIPALDGAVDMVLGSGTYSIDASTGGFASDAIGASRVDRAIDVTDATPAEFNATNAALDVSVGASGFHFRWLGELPFNARLAAMGTFSGSGGTAWELRQDNLGNLRLIVYEDNILRTLGLISGLTPGTFCLIDCIVRPVNEGAGHQTILCFNGQSSSQTAGSSPATTIAGDLDLLHFGGGSNTLTRFIFAGLRAATDFDETSHDADFALSGLS